MLAAHPAGFFLYRQKENQPMPITPNDLATQWSTRFKTLFQTEYNQVSDLIVTGQTKTGYDSKNFFAANHSEGSSGTQSNLLTGTGTSQAQIEADYYSAKSALMGFKDDQGVALGPHDFRPLVWIP